MPGADFDAIVVGAGFSSLYMLQKLRELGFSALCFEAAAGVGGTWWWNRYPGARCDIESVQYSFRFSEALQQEWTWSERYAAQPEILAYAEHIANRFDLRRDIRFETRVLRTAWDGARWTVETDRGDRVTAQFCIMASGPLSTSNLPAFPGLGNFAGETYHTGRWPHERVDFSGKRVAVIGTGSSAVQSIPLIAAEAEHLTVFQRTPNYVVPAHNGPLPAEQSAAVKANYRSLRDWQRRMPSGIAIVAGQEPAIETAEEQRQRTYETRWADGGFSFLYSFKDLMLNRDSNATAAEFVRAKLREVVADPEVAALLAPDTPIGCKRLCIDTGYWATFNRPNVTLVDVRKTPIERIAPGGVVVGDREYPADAIVFATGFDALTGTLNRIDIAGSGGAKLRDKWAHGPSTYLGLMTAGFPNLFIIVGPGSPSALTNVIVSIEQHVEWIGDCLAWLRDAGRASIEARPDAEAEWGEECRASAALTLRSGCESWYLGANIEGKPRVFMPYAGGVPAYAERCAAVAAAGYAGFALA